MRSKTLSSRAHAPVLALIAIALAVVPAPADAQDQLDPTIHMPPVSVPVAEPFRPPERPWGPGNRGLRYDTEPGTEVRASAEGKVVFAGRVAWDLHVTVRHADGVRTSYSFLSRITVRVGQHVERGDIVGLAGDRFHFGARRGDDYFDPATLFGLVEARIELLPLERGRRG